MSSEILNLEAQSALKYGKRCLNVKIFLHLPDFEGFYNIYFIIKTCRILKLVQYTILKEIRGLFLSLLLISPRKLLLMIELYHTNELYHTKDKLHFSSRKAIHRVFQRIWLSFVLEKSESLYLLHLLYVFAFAL